ncbi:MAG: efflux RND transporter periplasmic adaptor subunit [bacterium]|nr:efflux RND transporter periplasmic adaptor subunit [bacterium]
MKKVFMYGLGIILVMAAGIFLLKGKNGTTDELKLVKVRRGMIAEKALAVGTIEPDKEIKVKSAISGIISEVYFKVGDKLEKGSPLFKVAPNPTPLEYVEAKRNMELAEVAMKQLTRERKRKISLHKELLIPRSEMEEVESRFSEFGLKYRIARERFQLLENGRIRGSGKSINSLVKSPISGVVLSGNAYVGDPVVPLTTFQPGTELYAMADMGVMLFKGTVDEIDVGKLESGMQVDIQVGALPGTVVTGKLLRISPKAKKDGNATLFDIEVSIEETGNKVMRAGYSATAYVKIRERKDVLVIPERLVIFKDGKTYVEIKKGEAVDKIEIKTGLSDSLNIEVLEGLKDDQEIVERPPREIT